MTVLYVRAHWSDSAPVGQTPHYPAPPWASAYPGPVPLQAFAVNAAGLTVPDPVWPTTTTGPLGPKFVRSAWFPVVKAADLDSSGWSTGTAWAGSPPPAWEIPSGAPAHTADVGYANGATGFRVDRLRVWQGTSPGSDFVLTITAPAAAWSTTLPLTTGWTNWVNVPAALADAKGIWSLQIERATGSAVSEPAFLPNAVSPSNAVHETYVSPYGSVYEGILGVEVEGTELSSVMVTPSGAVVVGDCDVSGHRPTALTVNFTPALPVGWSYSVTWSTTLAPPFPSTSGTVTGAPLPSVSTTVSYMPSTVYPTATVTLTPTTGASVTTLVGFTTGAGSGVLVANCTDAVCHDLSVSANRSALCVDASGTTGVVTFTASVTPATPAWTGPLSWTVRDQLGAIVPLPLPSPTGATLSMAFHSAGRYTVTAAIARPSPCDPLLLAATLVLDVADCRCPTVSGGLHATQVDGCEFAFSAQVTPAPSGGAITYLWDFGDQTTSTAAPPVNHRYAPGSSGQRTVTLTVLGQGNCESTQTVTVTLDCSHACPAFAGGIQVAAIKDKPCDFSLSVATSPPTAAGQVVWNLPNGQQARGSGATVSIAPGASPTVTATLSSPGCPDITTSTTLRCASAPDPDLTSAEIPACDVLLVLAVILLLLGGIVVVVGVCSAIPWVIVVGGIVAAVGLVLFVLWALLCANHTPCSLMQTLHCLLFWIVAVVVPVVTLLLLVLTGLPCGIASAVTGVAWGSIYAWLGFIMRRVGCMPTC